MAGDDDAAVYPSPAAEEFHWTHSRVLNIANPLPYTHSFSACVFMFPLSRNRRTASISDTEQQQTELGPLEDIPHSLPIHTSW